MNLFADTDPDLKARFKKFCKESPHVYKSFRNYAHMMRDRGREKYSAWTIINKIRWDQDISTKGDPFLINNDFIALYARTLIHREPEFEKFFDLRKMKPRGRKRSAEENERLFLLDP